MRILMIEKDTTYAVPIVQRLQIDGTFIDEADDGLETLDLGKIYDYDLILVGHAIDMTPLQVVQGLRAGGVSTPVIVLGANPVTVLSAGADDHLPKPVNISELQARINAVVRRSQGHARSVISFGDLDVDVESKIATWKGAGIPLTRKEYAMLELLARRRGITVTKQMFLDHLYGGSTDDEPEAKIIDVFICKLRAKLLAATGHRWIDTIWGRGFALREPAAVAV